MHSIFANTVNIYTLYIHTFTICILQPNRPKYQSRSRSQANDKWHDVICAKSLIDTHESCCGSSSGEVPRPRPHAQYNPHRPHRFLLRVTLSAVWYPTRQGQGRIVETYSMKQEGASTGYVLVVQWGSEGLALHCLFPNLLHFCCCCAWGVPKNGQMRWWSWF